jgi:hypothetical protein
MRFDDERLAQVMCCCGAVMISAYDENSFHPRNRNDAMCKDNNTSKWGAEPQRQWNVLNVCVIVANLYINLALPRARAAW